MRMLEFHSSGYERICIFVKRTDDGDGWLCLEGPSGKKQEIHMGKDWYRMVQFALPEDGTYRLGREDIEIAQLYLSGGEDLLERGVCFLHPDSGKAVDLGRWYDTPIREQFHFGPFANWVNDPNGLCWYQGYYHLFYQANPFGQEWNDMYWGHAVSKDMVHWVHLPHVLEPQHSLWKDRAIKGGAFSGSAVVEADGIHLYLTRHEGPQEDGAATREWQTRAVCRDGIHVGAETVLLEEKPPGVSCDFRDPKVGQIDGRNYMVLGAAIDKIPTILLYGQDADGNWTYRGPLLQERTEGIRTFECPDFFELDGAYVALGAWMCHHDEYGRYQMTRCYIGDFDGEKLKARRQQWYDFGSNFYAVQSFVHEGRRIAVGWISDFYEEHRKLEHGAYGSFALPRELSVRDGRLFMVPAKECYGLLEKQLFLQTDGRKVDGRKVAGNSFFVRIRLNGNEPFKVVLARDGEESLSLVRNDNITSLVSTRKEVEGKRFPSDVADVREIEIFVDRRVTEVFLNRGEGAGTKLFYQDSSDGYLEAEFGDGDLKQFEVWNLKSIWK